MKEDNPSFPPQAIRSTLVSCRDNVKVAKPKVNPTNPAIGKRPRSSPKTVVVTSSVLFFLSSRRTKFDPLSNIALDVRRSHATSSIIAARTTVVQGCRATGKSNHLLPHPNPQLENELFLRDAAKAAWVPSTIPASVRILLEHAVEIFAVVSCSLRKPP
ncbi:hypothetical protein BC827DRAFT_355775 [Russula dissimulans]|nr:hypothetical protein BC827DRAFT_355775 [Russula dissimulans]